MGSNGRTALFYIMCAIFSLPAPSFISTTYAQATSRSASSHKKNSKTKGRKPKKHAKQKY